MTLPSVRHARRTAAAMIAALLASATTAQVPPPPPAETLIRNVAVFDGDRALGRHDVLIRGGIIADTNYRGKVTATMRSVDGTGKTLLPGLIDAHVHAFGGQDDALLFGVTTQLDMFSAPQSTAAVRAKMAAHSNPAMADIFTSGILATVPKGHGTEYGFDIPTLTAPAEADAFVAARIAEGSDFIKIIDEPGTTVGRKIPTLDAATITAIVTAAHKRGKLAVVHVQSLATATESVNAGADGLAHLFIDQDGGTGFAALARAHHIFVIPTYTVFEGFAGRAGAAPLLDVPALAGLLPAPAITSLKEAFGKDRAAKLDAIEAGNISALARAGVPILAGTDAGNPGTWWGLSLHHEIDLLAKAGLSPAAALTAATAAPARAFRLADRGRIARGLKADLLMVNGDPLTNLAAVHDIAEIWKDGQSANSLRDARRTALIAAASVKGPPPLALPAGGRIGGFGLVSGQPSLTGPLGAGWQVSTDSIAGGTSVVALAAGGTAPKGQQALALDGVIKGDFIAPWAGVAFNPGAQPFQPGNLSAATAIRFWARGTGKGFAVMGFSTKGGPRPSTRPISVGAEWAEVTVNFADLAGFDPAAATLLLITATQPAGPFHLEIADVRLVGAP